MKILTLFFVMVTITGCDVFGHKPKINEKHSEIAVLEADNASLVMIRKDSDLYTPDVTYIQLDNDNRDPVLSYLFAWRQSDKAKRLREREARINKRAKEGIMLPFGTQNAKSF